MQEFLLSFPGADELRRQREELRKLNVERSSATLKKVRFGDPFAYQFYNVSIRMRKQNRFGRSYLRCRER
jgi:hypothetical protein